MAQKGKPFIEYVNGLPVEVAPDSGDAIYLGGDTSRRTNPGDIGGEGGVGAVDSVNGFSGVVSLDADDIPDAATTNQFATQAQLDFVDSIVTDPTFDGLVTHDGSSTDLKRTAGGGTYLKLFSDTANYVAFFDEGGTPLGYIDVDATGNYWRFRNAGGDIFFQYDVGTGVVTFPDGGSVDVSFDDPFDGTAPTATAFNQTWVPDDTKDGYIWSDVGDGIVANGTWVQFASAASLAAVDAADVPITDTGDLFIADNVEDALAEVKALADAGGGGAVDSVNGATGAVVLDADDIDDTSTTNKFATAAQLTAADNAISPTYYDGIAYPSRASVNPTGPWWVINTIDDTVPSDIEDGDIVLLTASGA